MINRIARIIYLAALLLGLAAASRAQADRVEVDLSGPGWRLLQDKDAAWENDELFLPPVSPSQLPTNPPTQGWTSLTDAAGIAVSVPGTAEEYLGDGGGPSSDVKGVTWWFRQVQVPAQPSQRLLLQFEATRHRAEIYVDGKLVGYDIIGSSPFEVDLTEMRLAGKTVQLAVRITDPGGNFDWIDFSQFKWGKYTFPMSHGFGGITGGVKLVITDNVHINDLHIQNTPAMRDVNVLVTVRNTALSAVRQSLTVDVLDDQTVVATRQLPEQELPPGETTLKVPLSVPDATLWDTDNPKLYTAKASLSAGDSVTDHVQKRFGFRWFAADGIGTDAVFRLNGKRIFLTTAISWGFWPTNGMYATPEMAEKQIRAAKSLGMNMLNFHRAIGSTVILDMADELGLLYFAEPGNYVSGGREPFGQALSRDKLLRMVKRDRSHPSLVIYNMINEQWNEYGADKDDALFSIHREDLRKARELDPSRIITYTSAWSEAGKEQRAKLHVRPFDDREHYVGWHDSHRATGPETWQQEYYLSPSQHIATSDNNISEIVYRGEEGAISAPPRLEMIHADLAKLPRHGWDGAVYEQWYQQFAAFLDRKQLRQSFPSVDALTSAMGEVSLEHQGRRIQAHRIVNIADGYAINGWEAEVVENHSGIVDCFRNPKADPAIMSRYLQPLYVAVMPRSQVLHAGAPLLVDLYVVNEKDINGPHLLSIEATDGNGGAVFTHKVDVAIAGGDTYGQLLAEAVSIPSTASPGMWTISATLVDAGGQTVATGNDKVLLVDWKSSQITGNGAIYERKTHVREFLANHKGVQVPAYRDDLGKLDWLLVTVPSHDDPDLIPASALRDSTGQAQGLTATFFEGQDFSQLVHQRTDAKVDLDIAAGGTPDPKVGMTQNYSIRWEGSVIPPATGTYTFAAGGDDGVRLWIDGKLVIEDWKIHQYRDQVSAPIQLEAGKPVQMKLEFFQAGGGAKCMLKWIVPAKAGVNHDKLFQRAIEDGTTLLFLERPETWLDQVVKHSDVKTEGTFTVGMNWLGGQFFAKKHPLLDGLPVDCTMNWPYQRVVRYGPTRFGMRLEGEELVAGAYQSWPMSLGTAIGVVNCGKGRIILSSLDICGALQDADSTAEVARKMLCNYIRFSSREPNAEASGND